MHSFTISRQVPGVMTVSFNSCSSSYLIHHSVICVVKIRKDRFEYIFLKFCYCRDKSNLEGTADVMKPYLLESLCMMTEYSRVT